jgi:HK97 family phage prohead protease
MTFHRALGFVDRSALTDDSPLRVVMASEGRMADKIDLRMSGADLARFRGNPVLGYGHSYWGRTNLPIGRVDPDTLMIADRQLSGEIQFDQGDEFAREVERKMRAGYLNAVSIGFDVTQWESAEDSYWRGGVATKWELSELSVVPVPMDAKALVTSGRSLDPGDPAVIRELAALSEEDFAKVQFRMQILNQAMNGRTVELLKSDYTDPEPQAPEINPDAARSLLAAFAPKEN